MVFEKLPVTHVSTPDLEDTIYTYINELPLGYRLEMIKPADHPSEAWLSNGSSAVCLKERLVSVRSKKGGVHRAAPTVIESEWHMGRAGMEYRDLIPGRLGGRMIASHIRLTKGGDVPDYVHYHKVNFQMIYCLAGSIRVVYEDQGGPFWLNPGDCVLQPPEIRHRVLECTAGSEVVEVGMPAVHETWVEHEIKLPTREIKPDRIFNGQRFVRHIAAEAAWTQSEIDGIEMRDTGISAVTNDRADVRVLRPGSGSVLPAKYTKMREIVFCFVLTGSVRMGSGNDVSREFTETDAFVMPTNEDFTVTMSAGSEILAVCT